MTVFPIIPQSIESNIGEPNTGRKPSQRNVLPALVQNVTR
jgi:hypothetical protein